MALGWRQAGEAPYGGGPFLAIEAGSTGIHECTRDADGHFWIEAAEALVREEA